MAFTPQDYHFMQQAIALAKQGRFTTPPNPCVGCVLVKNGEIVGQGFHLKAGEPHAEVMALRMAGEQAKGATAYVTLEPCAHFGRTPPCALGLINAGVARVVAAMYDPNPQVAGKGMQMLTETGIETEVGLFAEQAELLNQGFLKRMRTGLPFVQLKMAMSIDGKTAMASGESKWITGERARSDVQVGRAQAAAILSSSATVLADDPLLNVRHQQFPADIQSTYPESSLRQPVRVILDSQHRVQPTHQLFQLQSPVWLVGTGERDMSAFPDFCEWIALAPTSQQSLLQALMVELGKRQINSLWVEAGATLAGALIEQQLVDQLIVYMAPKLLGDQARGLCYLPHLTHLADAPLFECESVQTLGGDIKMVYQPKETKC